MNTDFTEQARLDRALATRILKQLKIIKEPFSEKDTAKIEQATILIVADRTNRQNAAIQKAIDS